MCININRAKIDCSEKMRDLQFDESTIVLLQLTFTMLYVLYNNIGMCSLNYYRILMLQWNGYSVSWWESHPWGIQHNPSSRSFVALMVIMTQAYKKPGQWLVWLELKLINCEDIVKTNKLSRSVCLAFCKCNHFLYLLSSNVISRI